RDLFASAATPRAICALIVLLSVALASCTPRAKPAKQPTLADVRAEGAAATDADVAATWLLRELVSPGGDAGRAKQARAKRDTLGQGGLVAGLARGLDDALHGRMDGAAEHYLEAARAARVSRDPRAPLFGWFAANRAVALSDNAPELWKRWRPFVEEAIRAPGALGWRARSELVEWSIDEEWAAGTPNVERRAVDLYGCLTK